MKLAITGCNGRVGKRVVALALKRGYTVVGIDHTPEPANATINPRFSFLQVDLRDYDQTLKALRGYEGVIQLAAFPNPGDYAAVVHNSNVTISWNVLRAAAELGITRIAQASSVNVITMVYSQSPRFDYFPIDEKHPCLPDEPYGLSKLICELQADAIIRRYPALRVASLRLHWSVPSRSFAKESRTNVAHAKNDLWGYVQEDSAADAFLLAVAGESGRWSGHEAFFIAAPHVSQDEGWKELRETYWPGVPVRGGVEVNGPFDCSKAERLLEWAHKDL